MPEFLEIPRPTGPLTFSLILLIVILPVLIGSEIESQAAGTNKKSNIELLADIAKFSSFQAGSGILFTEQNLLKLKVIRAILSKDQLSEKVELKPESNEVLHYFAINKRFEAPVIEFKKINPIKYRLRIHNVRADFPLVFSEKFHPGWKAYVVPWKANTLSPDADETQNLLASYEIFEGNGNSQAGFEELKEFLAQGWVTDLEYAHPSEKTPYSLILSPWKKEAQGKNFKTGFISKVFFGTIQNDNLPTSSPWEAWFSQKMIVKCYEARGADSGCKATDLQKIQIQSGWNDKAIQWPDLFHWQLNAFANSWWIKTDYLRQLPQGLENSERFYKLNSDGSIDFEMVIEYWPQRLFYLGWAVSIMTFVFCVLLLSIRWMARGTIKANVVGD